MTGKELIQEMVAYLQDGKWRWIGGVGDGFSGSDRSGCLLQLNGHICYDVARAALAVQNESVALIAKAIGTGDPKLPSTAVMQWNDTVCQSQEEAVGMLQKALTL